MLRPNGGRVTRGEADEGTCLTLNPRVVPSSSGGLPVVLVLVTLVAHSSTSNWLPTLPVVLVPVVLVVLPLVPLGALLSPLTCRVSLGDRVGMLASDRPTLVVSTVVGS